MKLEKRGSTQKHTEETKRKISLSRLGDKNWAKRPEVKQKISKAMSGANNFFYGKHLSKDHRDKISKTKIDTTGGISFEPYTTDWTETLKRSIRERDNYICQLCNQYGNAVHHKDYDKKNCNPNNLIILCISCNVKVNYNREYWKQHFGLPTMS